MIRIELVYSDGVIVYEDLFPARSIIPTKTGVVTRSRLVGADPEKHWIDLTLDTNWLSPSVGLSINPVTISSPTIAPRIFGWDEVDRWLNPPREVLAQGATCKRCKEHNEYAEPSSSYVCYRCR